jgi:uncharacterized protein (DUF58 family)
MRKIKLTTIILGYTLLVLLAAAGTATLPYIVIPVVLLLIVLLPFILPQPLGINIVINLLVISLGPLAFESGLVRLFALSMAAAQFLAVIIFVPFFYRLDQELKKNATSFQMPKTVRDGRRLTKISVSLVISASALIIMAPLVNHLVLLLSGGCILLYMLGMLLRLWFTIPRRPFSIEAVTKRIIAGTESNILIQLNNPTSLSLRAYLRPLETWLKVSPDKIILNGTPGQMGVSVTPPLAGQSRPRLQITAIDNRGLIEINQQIEPVQLHVIPRAKYAEWLATKYLEQASSGTTSSAYSPLFTKLSKHGVEYSESRTYQPGDALRDVDWKHTLKLSQMIVSEYEGAGDQAVIIAVNLSVADAEEADKVAFNLITAAVTMAIRNIPAALIAYNDRDVILSSELTHPQEILKQALLLVKDISSGKFSTRYLAPLDINRLKRNINLLKQTKLEPARKLLDIFNFELQALEDEAGNHPATLALISTAKRVPAPAMILLVSQLNHDAEAILVTCDKLARRKYTTLQVKNA